MSNTGKDGVITLGGREFKRVRNGVDESEIAVFIDELIGERDELAKAKHHIASLTKLAETTIVEADRMAAQIKAEASEQAKAERAALIDEAKERARQIAERKQAEVLEIANEKASAIRSEAEKEATTLLENAKKKVWDELRSAVNQQFSCLLKELESLKQRAAAAQADFESKMSHPAEESGAITADSDEEGGAAPVEVEEQTGAAVMDLEKEANAATSEEGQMPGRSPESADAEEQSERGFDLARLLQSEDWAESSEPQFEVEILPPIHMTRIMEVVAHLDQLPEVANTEIIPRMDSPSILVFLRQDMNLVDALRSIPAVAYVEEVTTDVEANNGEPTKEPRKVRIGLSGNTMPQQKR